MATTLTTFSAREAKARFGEVLDEALGRPVGISRHDRLTAYLVSKRDFDAMVQKIQELEDQLWLIRADIARKEGFASPEQIDTLLSNVRKFDDADNNDKTISQNNGGTGR